MGKKSIKEATLPLETRIPSPLMYGKVIAKKSGFLGKSFRNLFRKKTIDPDYSRPTPNLARPQLVEGSIHAGLLVLNFRM